MPRSELRRAPARAMVAWMLVIPALVALANPLRPAAADNLVMHTPLIYGRDGALTAYDSRRHRVVQFGGRGPGFDTDTIVSLLDPASGAGWSRPAVLGTPPTLSNGSAVYDSTGDRVLVFSDEGDGAWSLSCAAPMAWTALHPAGTPPRFTRGRAIWDPVRNRVVGFGGETSDGQSDLNVTWALSLGVTPTWSTLTTAGGTPPARGEFGCAYDPAGDRMLVFGGETLASGTPTYRNDLMALGFAGGIPTWNSISVGGTPPGARIAAAVAFDTAGDRLLVSEGTGNTSTDNTRIIGLGDPVPAWNLVANGLGGRPGTGCVFDPVADRVLVFGGSAGPPAVFGDAWQWFLDESAPKWTELAVPGVAPTGATGIGYDPYQSRFVTDLAGSNGDAAWFLSAHDSTWSPTLPTGTPPLTGFTHPILAEFYDARRGVYYASSIDTLFSYTPGANPAWTRTPIGGTPPTQPGRVETSYFDDVAQRFFLIGGVPVCTTCSGYTLQFASLSVTPPVQWTIVAASTPLGTRQTIPVLDTRRNRLVLFGGAVWSGALSPPDPAGDLWQLDLATLAITSLNATGVAPSPRYAFDIAYDSLRDRVVIFGGGSFNAPAPGAYYLQFGPSDDQGAWTRNDPTGATLPGFLSGLGGYDAARGRIYLAGTSPIGVYYELIPDVQVQLALGVDCPPRTAWTPGSVLPLQFSIVQGPNNAHDYAWRVDGARAWPGFPLTGTQTVSAAGTVQMEVGIPVPDTAAAGLDSLRFSVHDLADPTLRDSCGSMIGDISSPVMWAITGSSAGAGSVSITWWVADRAASNARVERRTENEPWAFLSNVPVRGDGLVVLTDASVTAGERYDYRAGILSSAPGGYDWSPDAWVAVPAAGPLALAFANRGALLVHGALDVSFTLPAAGTARLDAYDLRGRRVASAKLDATQGGAYVLHLADAGALRSGVYFLRLTQGAASARGRALLLGPR